MSTIIILFKNGLNKRKRNFRKSNSKSQQLSSSIEELNEANQILKEKVNELEKILEPIVTTLSITNHNKDNILEPLLKIPKFNYSQLQ